MIEADVAGQAMSGLPDADPRLIPIMHRFLVPFILPTGLALLAVAGAGKARAGLLINEVNIDPPGSDGAGNYEYIELVSTTGGIESADGLTLLVIDSNNGGYGRIRQRWALDGMSTGANGILIIGNNYPAQFPFGVLPSDTGAGDPSRPDAMDNGEVDPNGGFTLFLVSGLSSSVVLDFDLDPNDDGRLDVRPWTALIDSVGFDDRDPTDPPNRETYALADLTQNGWEPENMSRLAGDFRPNERTAWFAGGFPSSAPGPESVSFDPARIFNGFPGASATPGLPNAPLAVADLRINEASINPNGNDENVEFIELVSVSGNVERADGYHLVLVANDPLESDLGVIEQAWDLAGLQTGANGLLLIGDGYAKPSPGRRADTPFRQLVEPETAVGDPEGFGRNEIEPSNGVSILLVTGFTGVRGQDVDADNDGTVDPSAPWEAVVDSIGFDNLNEVTGGRSATYAPAALSIAGFYPDNVSRLAGRLDANDPDAWYGGDYAGDSQTAVLFNENRFAPLDALLAAPRATPGAGNLASGDPAPEPDIFINELLVDAPPSPLNADDNTHEFIELISAGGGIRPMDGLTLVLVNTEAGSIQSGVVRQAIDLSGLSTGPNGLCVIGDSYNDLLVDAPVPFETHREDPQGLNAGDIAPNEGLTVLLVRAFTGGTGLDLDTDDDGIFDLRPWASVEDGVGFGTVRDPDVANLSQPGFTPDTFARLPGRVSAADRAASGAWYGGVLEGDPRTPGYGASWFGPFRGGVTRGFGNHAATPAAEGTILLNEVVIDPVGTDTENPAECVEILATTVDARSLSGYAVVVMESAGGSVGDILHIWDLSGFATGPNGLLLLGDGYAPGSVPYVVDPETAVAAPPSMKAGDIGDNNAFSLLLVKGLRPTVNEALDLDANPSQTLDNDGNLDLQPWEAIVDSVGFREYDPDLARNVGVTYGRADLSRAYDPDTVARIASRGLLNPNSTTDWYGGELGGVGPYSVVYEPGKVFGPGLNLSSLGASPGRHNFGGSLVDVDALDPDGDGRSNLMEEALGSDPGVADAAPPLNAMIVADSGADYPGLSYPRRAGGATDAEGWYVVEGLRYGIEGSADLRGWTFQEAEIVGSPIPDPGDPAFERATVRLRMPVQGSGATRQFLRLRVERAPSP